MIIVAEQIKAMLGKVWRNCAQKKKVKGKDYGE